MTNNTQRCCFQEWMNLQEQDLSELIQALNIDADGDQDTLMHRLLEKGIEHFKDYMDKRARLAREDVSTYFAPSWCAPLERSVLWIAGCRPSKFIRLLYALIGTEFESQLEEYLEGKRVGNLGDVSLMQMNSINSLQCKTIKEEDKLSSLLASLQEDLADHPICIFAWEAKTIHDEPCREVREKLDEHGRSMVGLLEEADMLRLNTLKELISILTPIQAVNYLAAAKKLNLCLHEWAKRRDNQKNQ